MEKTTWSGLSPEMRAELEALLASPTDAWLSDFDEVSSLWIVAFLTGLGGSATMLWYIVSDFRQLGLVGTTFGLLLTLAVFGAGVWAAMAFLRNKGRRGYAALSDAVVVVRGDKLRVLRYDQIAGTEQKVVGNEQKSFTVLTATLRDGSEEEFYVQDRWAKKVVDRLEW